MGVLIRGARQSAMGDRALTIVCADNVARILEIAGLGQKFAVFKAREKAARRTGA